MTLETTDMRLCNTTTKVTRERCREANVQLVTKVRQRQQAHNILTDVDHVRYE